MVRLLFPETQFIGSFIATSSSITMQQNKLDQYLVLVISSKKGHVGIRVNKTYKMIEDNNILEGGPIELGLAFHLIHTNDFNTQDTSKINDKIGITKIPSIKHAQRLEQKPKQYILTTGYMSWIKGQLEDEIINGLWLPIIYNHEVLFETHILDRWRKAYKISGITPEYMGLYDAHL